MDQRLPLRTPCKGWGISPGPCSVLLPSSLSMTVYGRLLWLISIVMRMRSCCRLAEGVHAAAPDCAFLGSVRCVGI